MTEELNPVQHRHNPVLHLMRGVAILLVVVGHALGPVWGKDAAGFGRAFIDVIYSFHMPLFIFVSGFLGMKFFVATRDGYTDIVAKQFKRLMAVYFFYSAVAVMIKLPLQGYVNRPIDLSTSLTDIILYPGRNPLVDLWFIYCLFVVQILFLTLNRIFKIDYHKGSRVMAVMVLVLAANMLSGSMPTVWFGLKAVARYGVFFFAGYIAGQHRERIENIFTRYLPTALACAGLYFLYAFVCHNTLQSCRPLTTLHAMAGIIAAWVGCLALAQHSGGTRAFFSYLADYSYEIYLNGGMLQVAVEILIYRVLHLALWLVFPFATAVGLIGPILLSRYIYRKNRMLRRFAIGDWKT